MFKTDNNIGVIKMNFCNCGCYLGFPISNFSKQIENSLIYDTSMSPIYRNQAISLIDFKLNNLMAGGIFPKYQYFSHLINPIQINNTQNNYSCCMYR